jgi:pentatricopeptide repeat protein
MFSRYKSLLSRVRVPAPYGVNFFSAAVAPSLSTSRSDKPAVLNREAKIRLKHMSMKNEFIKQITTMLRTETNQVGSVEEFLALMRRFDGEDDKQFNAIVAAFPSIMNNGDISLHAKEYILSSLCQFGRFDSAVDLFVELETKGVLFSDALQLEILVAMCKLSLVHKQSPAGQSKLHLFLSKLVSRGLKLSVEAWFWSLSAAQNTPLLVPFYDLYSRTPISAWTGDFSPSSNKHDVLSEIYITVVYGAHPAPKVGKACGVIRGLGSAGGVGWEGSGGSEGVICC